MSTKTSRAGLFFYAAPAMALAMPTIPVYVYLPSYYASALGLSLTAVGTALMAARVLDVFTDPVIGALSDRSTSRYGRRKPWIIGGGLIAAVALLLLFMPSENPSAVYLFGAAALLYFGWTLIAVPYTAWGAEISSDYHTRAKITGAREAATIIGILIAGSIPAIAAGAGLAEGQALLLIAVLSIGIGAPLIALLVIKVKEPVVQAEPAEVFSRNSFEALKANKPFARLLAAWVINGLANGIPAALFPLFMAHVLIADKAEQGILIGSYFLAGVAAIPFWLVAAKRWSKHRVWCLAMIMACVAFVWAPFLGAGDILPFVVICVITGAAFGADMALPPAMQADVIDLDRLKTREERAGLFFAFWSMGTKMSLALAVGIAFPALDAFGFDATKENTESALLALAVIYALVPVVLKVVAIGLVWAHPITERRQRIMRKRLEARAHYLTKQAT